VQTFDMINSRDKVSERLRSTWPWFVGMSIASVFIVMLLGALYLDCVHASFWVGVATITFAIIAALSVLWTPYWVAMGVMMILPSSKGGAFATKITGLRESIVHAPLPVPLDPPRHPLALREAR